MGEPLRVAPAELSGAGSSVAGLSAGLVSALGALTASYNANTGQDAAGTAFGFAYQDSARAVVDAVATGVNALRHTGYLIQGSATNYSRAEAAADIRGAAKPLPAPDAPATYSAPAGDPDVNGPGQSPPVLWYLVEFLVGDWWPNGMPSELRTAAAAWNAFATPLYGVTGENAGAYAVIGAQQIPEQESMKSAVRDIGAAMSSLAGQAQALAGELSSFATDVETTQNAIRDLLDTLKSVVGSVVAKGVLGTVFELVTGDAEEKIQQVADDIKAVIANHKRQSAARKELIGRLVDSVKNSSRAMEIMMRAELVEYFGEDAGRVAANVYDAVTDTSVGVTLGAINTVGGLVTGIDPIGDPKGTWATIEGLGKMALTFNPMSAPVAFALDPKGSVDMVKDVTHFDDIFTSNRPLIGVGESWASTSPLRLCPGVRPRRRPPEREWRRRRQPRAARSPLQHGLPEKSPISLPPQAGCAMSREPSRESSPNSMAWPVRRVRMPPRSRSAVHRIRCPRLLPSRRTPQLRIRRHRRPPSRSRHRCRTMVPPARPSGRRGTVLGADQSPVLSVYRGWRMSQDPQLSIRLRRQPNVTRLPTRWPNRMWSLVFPQRARPATARLRVWQRTVPGTRPIVLGMGRIRA